MSNRWRTLTGATLVGLAVFHPRSALVAQGTRLLPLGERTGVLNEGFTSIEAVGALSGGRIILADHREGRLVVGDFGTGEVRDIARFGDGPGEFRDVDRVFPIGRDSTIVVTRRPAGWLLFVGTKAVSTGRTWANGVDAAHFVGIDRFGNALELRVLQYGRDSRLRWVPTMYANAESLLVLRHRSALRLVLGRQVVDSFRGPAAASGDTLARIRGPWRGLRVPTRGSVGGAPLGHELHSPLASGEQAVLFPDGWIAIAYESPYRVVWVTPSGRRIVGRPLLFEGVKVDEAQQRFAIRRKHPRTWSMWEPDDFPPWPEYLPALAPDALIMLPDGSVAIHRMPDPRDPGNVYDIVDRRGALAGNVRLTERERLVGAGPGVAYVVRRDADDLEWMERRAWPR